MFKRDSRWTFCISRIISYHFKRLFGHETRCCSTSSERPSHKAIIVNEFMAKNSTNIIVQPTYSPDMAPAYFFLFPKLKLPPWGIRFQSIEDIKENSRRELIPENALKNVLINGLFVGISVLFREGPTLKSIK